MEGFLCWQRLIRQWQRHFFLEGQAAHIQIKIEAVLFFRQIAEHKFTVEPCGLLEERRTRLENDFFV